MLATLTDAPFDDPDWVFETKWDGFRLVASIEKRSVTLYSRNGLIVSHDYKPIAKALEKVSHDCVMDGELVAFDAQGVSRFQLLQNALRTTINLHYCVFDLMALDGKDLRGPSLVDRKERLRAVSPRITCSSTASTGRSMGRSCSRRLRDTGSKASWPSAR
jgi:bifunctional non-homologous end joining protein LigD